jgi:hypothetical protein
MPVFFNGRLWVTPATMSQVDDRAMYNKNASVGNVLTLIGRAEGGEPFKDLRFGSPEEAKAVLRGGEGLKAVQKAFDPSSETGSPATIVFVRVNPATQAALTLKDAANASVIDLVTEGYGKFANGIKVKIENASVAGKKVTTQFGNDYYSQDNVARNCFSVSYTGAGANPSISVTANAVTLVAGGASTVLDLNDFPTVGQLVDRINAVAGFVADVLDGNSEKPALNGLDSFSAQALSATPFTITGSLQAIVDWLNSTGEGFITATRKTNVGSLPANLPFTYLAGGSDGVTTVNDWQKGYETLQTIDAQWVVPISAEPAIHAMNDNHVAYMTNVARMERRGIVGCGTGMSDDNAILAAKALNSDRTSYTHLGIYDYNDAGKMVLFPAYIAAAQIAGAFAGVNPGTALTNRTLKVRGLERKLRNPTDTDRLINGGVLCIEDTPNGYKVVKSITTWLANTNYNRVEISVGVACDHVSRNVRNILDDLRGRKGSPALLSEAVSRVDSILRILAQPEPMGPGVIVGDKINPAYKNITATLEGDVLRVEFQASPVIPVNYIPIVIHAVPYSGSASA